MAGFTCPYCNNVMAVSFDTTREQMPSFESSKGVIDINNGYANEKRYDTSCVDIQFFKCPNCGNFTIFAKGLGAEVSSINTILQPSSLARQLPDYVPISIQEDYKEACATVKISPKASATLSRRCLQSMIRDFWGIKKGRLVDEINALKDKVPETQWKVLDSLRKLGNIGAHPEADVNTIIDIDPDDAQKLISVIELLIDQWYINKHEEEQLIKDVIQIDERTQSQRSNESDI